MRAIVAGLVALVAGSMGWAALGNEPVVETPTPSTAPGGGFEGILERMEAGGLHAQVAIVAPPAPEAGTVVVMIGGVPPEESLRRHLDAGGHAWLLTDNASLGTAWGSHGIGVDALRIMPSEGTDVEVLAASRPSFVVAPPRHLVVDEAWEPLLTTGPESHLDLDGDGDVDAHEPPGPYVLAAQRRVGAGMLMVTTVPAAFMDGGPDAAGQWLSRYAEASSQEVDRAIVDESNRGVLQAEAVATAAARWEGHLHALPVAWQAAALGTVALLTLLLSMALPPTRDLGRHIHHDPVLPPIPTDKEHSA